MKSGFLEKYGAISIFRIYFTSCFNCCIFANESMGSKYKVTANAVGSTLFSICKGKVKLFDVRVFVVNEYDLFIPESENKLFLNYHLVSELTALLFGEEADITLQRLQMNQLQ